MPLLTLTYKGDTLTIAEWSKRTGLSNACIRARMGMKWPVSRILTEAPRKRAPTWSKKDIIKHLESIK